MPYPSPLCCLTCWLLAGPSGNSRWTSGARDNRVCFFLSLPLSLTLPCVDSRRPLCFQKRPRVCGLHAHMLKQYVRVLPAYTETFLNVHTGTRRFSACHTTPHTQHDHSHSQNDTTDHTTDTTCTPTHNTTQHNTTSHTTSHGDTDRETEKEDRKRREDERGDRRQDKTKEKTRRKGRRDEEIKRR